MQKALDDIMKQRHKFINLSTNTKIDKSKILNINTKNQDFTIVNEFIDKLIVLFNLTIHGNDHSIFIKNNLESLEKLRNTLINYEIYNIIYTKKLKDTLKLYYNRIYNRLGYNNFIDQRKKIVSAIFDKFIQGIIYFKNEMQTNRWPIYHRDASCGSSGQTSISRFARTLFGSDKYKQLERCFIERHIYNILYTKIYKLQDLGHMFELQNIKLIFEKYSPKQYLEVYVDKYNGTYPEKLIIDSRDSITKNIIERHEYIKIFDKNNNIYLDDVQCYKKIYIDNSEYEKNQTFANKRRWKRI